MFRKSLLLHTFIFCALPGMLAWAQSPTAAARRFNIFVKGDLILGSSESEGPIAAGGNVTTNQYQIIFAKEKGAFFVGGASIGLAVRGGVKLNSGMLQVNDGNYVKIGNCTPGSSAATNVKAFYTDEKGNENNIQIVPADGTYGSKPNIQINAKASSWSPKVSDSQNPICQNVFGTGADQIDIDGAFETLKARSASLTTLTDNLPIRDQNGRIMSNAPIGPYLDPSVIGNNPKIIVDPSKINVLTVSAEVWETIKNSNVEGMPAGLTAGSSSYTGPFALVVNIVNVKAWATKKGNSTISFPSFGGLEENKASYIVYNFPDATETVTIGGNAQIVGTLLAPSANLLKSNSGNICGQIIAQTFNHSGDEVHFWPLLSSIPLPEISVTAQSKCVKNAPWLTYSVTPNFDATGKTVKVEWLNSDGTVVREQTGLALSGDLLFPGASVDGSGVGNNWPGYMASGGSWVPVNDLNSTIRNAGAKIRVTLSPTSTVDISYPGSSVSCFTSPPPPPDKPLPVTLQSFSVKNQDCSVALKWVVTDAKNFSHFVIERSGDARNFKAVGEVKYAASQSEYSLTDNPFSSEVMPVSVYYYRLRQVDLDQSFEYSVIRTVQAGKCDARLVVDFYPNPVQDELNVKSFTAVKELELFSSNGRSVTKMNVGNGQTEVKVDISDLPPGMYVVRIANGTGSYVSKVLKK